jgi:hypothetical protein
MFVISAFLTDAITSMLNQIIGQVGSDLGKKNKHLLLNPESMKVLLKSKKAGMKAKILLLSVQPTTIFSSL